MPPTENHANLLALYRNTCAMEASILRAGAALTASQREALIADLRSGDEERAKLALPLLGIAQSAVNEQIRLIRNFVAQHPLPDDQAQAQIIFENAFAAAKVSYSDDAGGGPAPDPLDEVLDELGLPNSDESGGSGDNTACLALCEAEALAHMSVAFAAYSLALAACVATGPFWPVCAVSASAAYALDIYALDAITDRCIENCS